MILAEPGQALVLADGTKIDPKTGLRVDVPKYVEVPNNKELKENYAAVQRRLIDLPLPPEKMNGLSVIMMYQMIGLPNYEIAVATGLSEEQIGNITMSDAFADLRQMVVENIHAADDDDIRAIMKTNASLGVQRITQLINSDDEKIAFVAAKDSLDRDGYRPNDVVEHRHKLEGSLTIEVIKRDHSTEAPVIDVEFSNINEGETNEY